MTELDEKKSEIYNQLKDAYKILSNAYYDLEQLRSSVSVEESIVDNVKTTKISLSQTPSLNKGIISDTKDKNKEFIDLYFERSFKYKTIEDTVSKLQPLFFEGRLCEVDLLFTDKIKAKVC